MLDAAKQTGSEANYIAVMVAEFGEQHGWRAQVRGRDGEDALPDLKVLYRVWNAVEEAKRGTD